MARGWWTRWGRGDCVGYGLVIGEGPSSFRAGKRDAGGAAGLGDISEPRRQMTTIIRRLLQDKLTTCSQDRRESYRRPVLAVLKRVFS
jgi:hypothetical protein